MTEEITLVTGGAGFLGRHVVAHLQENGATVRVLDVAPRPAELAGVDWVQGSITEPADLAVALAGAARVIHLAAVPHLWARPRGVFDRVNHRGTVALLDAVRVHGVVSMVHVSSMTTRIGGPAGGPARVVSEADMPPLEAMLGPYPRAKWLAEQAAREAQSKGVPVRIAIPTMPLGPGDRGLTPPTRMVLDFLHQHTPAYLDCWLNPCDVRDMAAGIVGLLAAPPEPEGYLLGGMNIRLGDFLKTLERLSGVAMPRRTVPGRLAEWAARVDTFLADHVTHRPPRAPLTGVRLARRPVLFDSARAGAVIGFAPRPLEATLRDLLRWFEAEGLWRPQRAG